MPFTAVTYNTGAAPGLDGPAFNAMQQQFAAAVNAFERDLFTAFVYSGLVATRDGTTLSQLDVTAGVAFLVQSASQNELYRVAPTATTFSATGHPSTTLFLDLNPDDSWSWGTAHSGVSGHLTIAQVTTDSGSNIVSVTDKRPLNTTLLSGMAGGLTLPGNVTVTGNTILNGTMLLGPAVSGSQAELFYLSSVNALQFFTPQAGATGLGIAFGTWTGSAGAIPFSIGGRFNAASSWVGTSGDIYDGGNRVAVQGAHSAGQPALSYGSGAPGALATNEIYFQVS